MKSVPKDTTRDETDDDENFSTASSTSIYSGLAFLFDAEQPVRIVSLQFIPGGAVDASSRTREGAGQKTDDGRAVSVRDPTHDAMKAAAGGDDNNVEKEEEKDTIRIELSSIDDIPGALQSGHYLWPAASGLAQYLVNAILGNHNIAAGVKESRLELLLPLLDGKDPLAVIELGAGCGLVGLAVLQALTVLGRRAGAGTTTTGQRMIRCVAFTDHDPGTLARARDNYHATLDRLKGLESSGCTSDENNVVDITSSVVTAAHHSLVEDIQSVPALFELLSWDSATEIANLIRHTEIPEFSSTDGEQCNGGYDLILGSDLIYCADVVRPLLRTAAALMDGRPHAVFVLAQSFEYDVDTEEEIDRVCRWLGLKRTVVMNSLGLENDGIQIQTFASIQPV